METIEPSTDVGIFIALDEEFRTFKSLIGEGNLKPLEKDDTAEQFYGFVFQTGEKYWNCVVAFGGQKGEQRASRVTERMIQRFRPACVAVLGIAGALSQDLHLGDVVVADTANSYMESSKIVDKAIPSSGKVATFVRNLLNGFQSEKNSFELRLAGEAYRTSHSLLVTVRNLEFASGTMFAEWVRDSSNVLAKRLEQEALERDPSLVGAQPKLLCGPIACGPAVVAAQEFGKFVLGHNRNYLAVEMESTGVLASTFERLKQPETIVIRGISDFADHRKKQLDTTGAGIFRYVAMHNAVKMLWCVLRSSDAIPQSNNVATKLQNQRSTSLNEDEQRDVNIAGCVENAILLRAESIQSVVEALESYFSFRWETGSYRLEQGQLPTVYWPIRLRQPTPIHAVQTFAAAALSRLGARVVLCLDDLGSQDHNAHSFEMTLRRWWSRVDKTSTFEFLHFSKILEQNGADTLDPWPIARRWLGETNKKLDEILSIAKVINLQDAEKPISHVLKDRRPRRILSPPIVWACMKHVANANQSNAIITLGGYDELPLWRAWRSEIADTGLNVGHLYIPTLGQTPLHMARSRLSWESIEDIRGSLEGDVTSETSGWRDLPRMVPWSLIGCVNLPDFVQSGCMQIQSRKLREDAKPDEVVPSLSLAIANRLLAPA